MRIALVYDAMYPWVAGGAERRFFELGRRLAARHDVHLVGWQWWDGPATIERDDMHLHGLGPAPQLYGGDGKRTVREAVQFSARLLPFLLRHRFDVVDCSATPYVPLYPAAAARRLRGGRLVVTWHEFWGSHWAAYLPHRRWVARVASALESHGRRAGDRVVTVSEFTSNAMGIAGDPRVTVIPNGVDVEALTSAVPMPDGADVVSVGRLIDEKHVDLLFEAIALLRARGAAPRTAIIGDGPERTALEARARDLALTDVVRFQGRVPEVDVPRYLRAARILALPSIREGYGMAVAEAQTAGAVPIVARGPFSAAPDLVRDGVDGLVVEPTAGAFADAIDGLLGDPGRLARMAAAARDIGASRSWDLVAEQMERVYRELLVPAAAAEPVKRRLRWS